MSKVFSRVLFLDIDGVLNSERYFVFDARKRDNLSRMEKDIDPSLMMNLRFIFDHVPALQVVISSVWRKLFPLVDFQKLFNEFNLPGSQIIGKTPEHIKGEKFCRSSDRIEQINEFVIENGLDWKNIAILDDNILDLRGESVPRHLWLDRFVQTEGRDGLTYSKSWDVILKFLDPDKFKPPVVML